MRVVMDARRSGDDRGFRNRDPEDSS